MKIKYDPSVDAAYIQLKSDDDHTSFGFTYCCDPAEVEGQVHLDFDSEGRLVGIEILQASKKLPQYLISTTETTS
ncbi:DUF2283 domain-containing protein [Sinirhodobacter huangdaonensis]|uniref:DUF2283 domain-containing protein n=1 Tax=Paenirhodobacter huangdaonensis TaxID=2501515 RepID=A0A3S3PBV7_9RHOB|nr:DUF2283 domain-containing protein [Sinirhodobacter huangdaonensis]RWR48380.1 DUF2283 domain-containing protein [Sinirhodobacter huangdaonensis]